MADLSAWKKAIFRFGVLNMFHKVGQEVESNNSRSTESLPAKVSTVA